MARPLKCAMRGRRQVWPPNSMPEGPRASGGRNPPPCRPRGGSGLTKTECVLTPLSCRRRYLLLYCAAGPLIFCRSWIIRRPRGRTQPRVLARIGDGARWSWKDLIALSELEITQGSITIHTRAMVNLSYLTRATVNIPNVQITDKI